MVDIGADLQRAFDEGYEKGKADEHRWWSEFCANCTDGDRPRGKWIETTYTVMCGTDEEHKAVYRNVPTVKCSNCGKTSPYQRRWIVCPYCDARMEGADNERYNI